MIPGVANKLPEQITLLQIFYLFAGYASVRAALWLYLPVRRVFSPLRLLPGPKSKNPLLGSLRLILESSNHLVQDEWAEEYGPIYAYRGLFSAFRLIPLDVRALEFIMTQSDTFPKPESYRRGLGDFMGQGLLFAESDTHKRQRRIIGPSFGSSHIRELMPICWQKAIQLKDILLNLAKSGLDGEAEINIHLWISSAVLDTIGVASFDYHFNSLEEDSQDELSVAFKKAFEPTLSRNALSILNTFVPFVKALMPDERTKAQLKAASIVRTIGTKLIAEKKALLHDEVKTGSVAETRNLLTLLIKSNMAPENKGQTMSDDEVLAQISTFVFAGWSTTTLSVTWALYMLARNTQVQHKLRQELLESGMGDEPNLADLDKLSYLDNVVHESLRLYPAVPATIREAVRDVHVPVSRPFKDRTGAMRDSIVLQRGDAILLPIVTMNRLKQMWGEDAREFRPERWDNLPEAVNHMPGVWGHVMTFLTGNRSCVGYRLAIAEIKALLYTLVRAIEFNINPGVEIKCEAFSGRPLIAEHPEKGNQMPLVCKPVLDI